jgi:lysophospholipase L1-like esterase
MRRLRTVLTAFAAALLLGATSATAAAADPGTASAPDRATHWYLALGDSLAAGYQPTTGADPSGGYVGHVLDALQSSGKVRLDNLACPGATSTSMLEGDRCTYDEGTQLAQAVEFLHAHHAKTSLVTIDIGANDVQRCVSGGSLDLACVADGMAAVSRNLPTILGALRQAAPDVPIVVLNYYDPFLAAWLAGAAGQHLAAQSLGLLHTLNGIIAAAAGSVGAEVADVAAAFHSDDTTLTAAGVPLDVAEICALTWMCSRGDIHANDDGYAVMGSSVVAVLPADLAPVRRAA